MSVFGPCTGCQCWLATDHLTAEDGVALGMCRRRAPITFYDIDHRRLRTRFPMVRADESCGQHMPLTAEEEGA